MSRTLLNRRFIVSLSLAGAALSLVGGCGYSASQEYTRIRSIVVPAHEGDGTRCSTVLITERVGRHLITHVYERSYPAGPGLALMRRTTLKDWPPRYQTEPVLVAERRARAGLGSVESPVRDDALDENDGGVASLPEAGEAAAVRVIRPRVRSLLKPARPRAPKG